MPSTRLRCRNVRSKLSGFLDGEYNHRARWRIRYHLLECEGCREELARLERVVQRIATLEAPRAPDELWERIARSARDRSPGPGARSRGALRPALAAAAGFALAAVLVLRYGGPPGPPDLHAAPPGPEERVVDEVDYVIWYFQERHVVRDRTPLLPGPRGEWVEEVLEDLVRSGGEDR